MKKLYHVALFVLGVALTCNAQERWGVAFRPQLNFPTTSFMDTDLSVGNGLELEVTYDVLPHLTFYTGFHWDQFETNEGFNEEHIDFNQSGYIFGGRLRLPFNKSKIGYYLSLGTIYNRIRLKSDLTINNQKTAFKLNWQLGTGVTIPLFDHWVFTPEIRYRSSSNYPITLQMTQETLNIDFITLSAGVMYRF
ncbi:outer membrane beta-barrel protein [Dokdonia ponticola]|uniref:Outer membrane beta-barrel protein n=1 Tax=Dokdonia ponticola TaxID=2041041 RepID=A0ABV9HUY9_9FLAO